MRVVADVRERRGAGRVQPLGQVGQGRSDHVSAQSADVIQAIGAVTGDLRWEHRREVPEDIDEYVFNNLWQNNRNLAIYGSFIIDTSVDDHVFALDAGTGSVGRSSGRSRGSGGHTGPSPHV